MAVGRKVAEAFVEISARLKPLIDGMRRARRTVARGTKKMAASMARFADRTERASRRARVALLVLGATAVGAAAKFSKFEQKIGLISTLLGDDFRKVTAQFAEDIKRLAIKYGESTDILAAGLFDIISASIPAAEAIEVLEQATIAAKGSTADTATVVNALTTIMNAYKLEAKDAADITDFLAVTAKRGKTDLNRLAPVIGRVASTAKAAGLKIEEMGAAIALFTRAGLSTEEAVTSLNAILSVFLTGSGDAKLAMDKFGITLDTSSLKTIGLTGLFKKLSKASAEQLAALFPNIRALKGVASGFQNSAEFAEDYAALVDRAGESQKAFGRASKGMAFQLDRSREALGIMLIEVGRLLFGFGKGEEAGKKLADQIADITKAIRELTPEQRESILWWTKFAVVTLAATVALTPLLRLLGLVFGQIGKIAKLVGAPFLIRIIVPVAGLAALALTLKAIKDIADAQDKARESNKQARRVTQSQQVTALEIEAEKAGATKGSVEKARQAAVDRLKEQEAGLLVSAEKAGTAADLRAQRINQRQDRSRDPRILQLEEREKSLLEQRRQVRGQRRALERVSVGDILAGTKTERDAANAKAAKEAREQLIKDTTVFEGIEDESERETNERRKKREEFERTRPRDIVTELEEATRGLPPLFPTDLGREVRERREREGKLGAEEFASPEELAKSLAREERRSDARRAPGLPPSFRNISALSDIQALQRGGVKRLSKKKETIPEKQLTVLEEIAKNTKEGGAIG